MATHRGTWKAFERVVARFFKTERNPLSGINSGHKTGSDSLHPQIYIECKYRDKHTVYTLWNDTLEKANAEKKIPVVALKQKGEKGYLLVIRPGDLQKLNELANGILSNKHTNIREATESK